jgi:hypothetical protein
MRKKGKEICKKIWGRGREEEIGVVFESGRYIINGEKKSFFILLTDTQMNTLIFNIISTIFDNFLPFFLQ